MGGLDLWNLNRFWSEKPCQTRTFAKKLFLMLVDILLLCTMRVMLPPAPSVVQGEVATRATRSSIHAKASAAKRLRSNGLRGDLLEADFWGATRFACRPSTRVAQF